jgi:hypothetical protein
MGCENVGWFHPTQNTNKWPALVDAVEMSVWAPKQATFMMNTALPLQGRFGSMELANESRRTLLGNGSVNTFPRQRILKQQ